LHHSSPIDKRVVFYSGSPVIRPIDLLLTF
jgi:hypothetical protein